MAAPTFEVVKFDKLLNPDETLRGVVIRVRGVVKDAQGQEIAVAEEEAVSTAPFQKKETLAAYARRFIEYMGWRAKILEALAAKLPPVVVKDAEGLGPVDLGPEA